jgi:hypothetical protein
MIDYVRAAYVIASFCGEYLILYCNTLLRYIFLDVVDIELRHPYWITRVRLYNIENPDKCHEYAS